MNNKKLLVVVIATIIVIVGLAAITFTKKYPSDEGIENQFTQSLVQGNCSAAYYLLSPPKTEEISSSTFQETFCKPLLGKELTKANATGDIDLDADTEYTTAYEISPQPTEGKYLLVGSRYFYESETITGVQFSNDIDDAFAL